MKSTKDKLQDLDRRIKKKWENIASTPGLSTREKLEKLVQLNVRREAARSANADADRPERNEEPEGTEPVVVRDFYYPLDSSFRRVKMRQWEEVRDADLALLAGSPDFIGRDPLRLLFFDSETTGLAGGTGTIPFMLGFGFIAGDSFQVRIFTLTDLAREGEMLGRIDSFLAENRFSAMVTYNGKAFDMPLLEARFILQRRRCPLLQLPHLDFLFPARALWRNTFESRRLGFLAETLVGISRSDDIEASEIPALYFGYLRSRTFALIEPVIEHNALDLLGLSATLLLALRYLRDHSLTGDEGEILGLAHIHERAGLLEKAAQLYCVVKESAVRRDVATLAVQRLALMMKRQKLFREAIGLWQTLADARHHQGFRELSIHYEHREKDLVQALEVVQLAIGSGELPEKVRLDMEKRLERLQKKIERLQREEAEGEE